MEFVRQTIEIKGCKLSLARGGKGVPLMYLHGTDGLADWPAILDTLAERFDVIVPDHPGFGASEAPGWIDDISDVAYCYLDAIEVLGLSGVHVVGQSLGAAGALAASRERPHPRHLGHLGRWRPHHSAGLCRGVPSPDPGIDAHHDSQRRPPAARRTCRSRGASDAYLPAELTDTAMKMISCHPMPYAQRCFTR